MKHLITSVWISKLVALDDAKDVAVEVQAAMLDERSRRGLSLVRREPDEESRQENLRTIEAVRQQ